MTAKEIQKLKQVIICENGGKHQVIYYTDAKKVIQSLTKENTRLKSDIERLERWRRNG